MSALAQAYIDKGCVASGADRAFDRGENAAVREILERAGARIFPEDVVPDGVDELVVSTAIEDDHPALVAAKKRNIPVLHRAKALAEVVAGCKLVAVTGTCGKSSVTAMLGHVLAGLGADPMVVNGAAVTGWDCNATRIGSCRKGAGEFAVIEADESDKSLVNYKPWAVVVTNASSDHYGVDEMNRVFDAFIASSGGGPVVDGRKASREAVQDGDIPPAFKGYNRQNAIMAVRMAMALLPGAGKDAVLHALESFKGVSRRLENVGGNVYDDYAHNTEKLRAMLGVMQEAYPDGVVAVWRPHGFAPLRKMLDDLAKMFANTLRGQDALVLLPVYDAGGTADRSVNSDALEKAIFRIVPGARVIMANSLDEARNNAVKLAQPCGGVVVCGARDPALPRLARDIAAML